MGAIASCFDRLSQPFLWHVKNVCVHGSASYVISRYAGASYPSHIAFVVTVFYAIINLTIPRDVRVVSERHVRPSQNSPSKQIMSMGNLRENSVAPVLERGSGKKFVPFLPQLALTSVMCHGMASRIGLKMPGLFSFLGVLWMNGSISECAIFHLDNCYQWLRGQVVVEPAASRSTWGPGRTLGGP